MKDNGFTLIELMITLAIISFLSAIAYPAYTRYWVQLKRLEGRLALLEVSIRLERYSLENNEGYKDASLQGLGVSPRTEHSWYHLHLEDVDTVQYRLLAKPTFEDSVCSELSCNAQGQRFYKGTGSYYDCWGE